MYLKRQQSDTDAIDALAVLCRGKIAVAALLVARSDTIETVHQAAAYLTKNPQAFDNIASHSGFLYYKWVASHSDEISAIISKIDFTLVSTIKATGGKSSAKFENLIKQILDEVTGSNNLLESAKKAYNNELEHNARPIGEVLHLLADIKDSALSIKGLCWQIANPWSYIFTDRRTINALLLFSVIAIPVWYFGFYHRAQVIGETPSALVSNDLRQLSAIVANESVGLWSRVIESTRLIFDAALVGPAFLWLAAAAVRLVRQMLPSRSVFQIKLQGLEQTIGALGLELQKQLPNPPSGAKLIINTGDRMRDKINISGGQIGAVGHKSTGTINNYERAWNAQPDKPDLRVLANELDQLVGKLRTTASKPDEYRDLADVSEAVEAAKNGDGPTTLEKLSKAGAWVLKVATDIGVEVAAAAITTALGIK